MSSISEFNGHVVGGLASGAAGSSGEAGLTVDDGGGFGFAWCEGGVGFNEEGGAEGEQEGREGREKEAGDAAKLFGWGGFGCGHDRSVIYW